MTTKPTTKRVVEQLRTDKRYLRLLKTFNEASLYNIPRDELIEEVKQIHSLREVRRLNIREEGYVDKLLNANTHDQAQRSRLTEILMTCLHVNEQLTRAIDALKQHLLMEYSDHLRSFRTKEERSMVLNIALRKFIRYLEDISVLKQMADLVISDIDKAGWATRASIEALKVTRLREVELMG